MTAEAVAASRTRLVVGCGYLGERVARRWREAGDRVLAVTRRESRARDLAAAGLEPLVADVTSATAWEAAPLPDRLDTVFWGVGFDRAPGYDPRAVHVAGLRRLLDALPEGTRVILASSTGVWGHDAGDVVDERTPPRPARDSGRVLVEAEEVLRTHRLGPGVALRFAGLYGPDRLPRLADLRAGVPIAADPDSWLNLVHVDDAARVVTTVAAAAAPRPLYVVSDGRPVRRREWYGVLARLVGAPPPTWDAAAPRTRGADKRVDPALLLGELGFRPAHPDALAALPELVAAAG